jgi:protein transport protein SEC61 subunit gamma-like protein
LKLFKRENKVPKVSSNKTLMEKARNLQHKIEERESRIGKGKYGRVFKMARKPTDEEYSKTSKITGAGILAIGGVGFLIFLIAKQLAPWVAQMLGL